MGKKQKVNNLLVTGGEDKKPQSPRAGYLTKIADQESKALIDSGKMYDPEYIKEHGMGEEAGYQGIGTYYGQLDKDAFDKYDDYIGENVLKGGQFTFDELNKIRANNQSNWEQTGNAVARVATNIIPQIVSGFASMLDIPGYFSAEEAANNSIVNWAMDAKKTVDEDWFPIYEENPGQSMQLGDFAWWMSRGSGLVESIGAFLAQGAGMGKLVSVGLKGLGTLTRGKQLATAVLGAEGSQRLYAGSAGLLNAVALNQSEAVLEATQVFRDTYDEQMSKNGGNAEKAKQAASVAAATTMNINRANILLNLTSASAFITPLKSTRKLFELPTIGKSLGITALEGGQEAVEELVNLAASKAGMAKGKGKEYSFEQAMKDIGSMEGLEAAFLGAIGGIAQTGGTKALGYSKYGPGSMKDEQGNRISKVAYERDRYKQQQEVLEELKQKGVKTTDVLQDFKDQIVFQEKLKAANEKGDVAEMERLKNDMFENQALKAFRSGTTEVLEDLYKYEASRPVEEVGQEYIDRANQAIKNLKDLEKVYNNFEGYENSEELFFNRANKIRAERAANELNNQRKEADLQFSKDVRDVASKYSFENDKEILFKKEGQVTGSETRTEKSPLIYSTTDIENNTGDTEKNKKIYNKFLKKVQSLPSYELAKAYQQQGEEIDSALRTNAKQFQELTSAKHQAKVKAEKAEVAKLRSAQEELKNAKDISAVERLKNSIDNAEFKKQADAKIEELKLRNDKDAKLKEIQVTLEKFRNKINNATLENLEDVKAEINSAELSTEDKQNLLDNVNERANQLADPNSANTPVNTDPLSAFTQGKSDSELDSEIKSEQESFETEIPADFPNPSKEQSSVEEGVAESASKLLESDTTTVVGQDEQGNLIYNYNRSKEGFNSAAFLSREFNQTEEVATVNREEITDSLDNIKLLDPDFLTPGTELEMEVDTDYSGEKYSPDSNTRETISWPSRLIELQALADKKGVALTQLDEYIAEVPIKVTTPGVTGNVFYIHDNAWYKEENLSATPEEIAIDKAKNFAVRKAIITKGKVKSKVNYKSFGRLFKTFDGRSISVSEAMPDSNLILATGTEDGFKLPGEASTLFGEKGKVLPTKIQNGRLYAIVKVGPNEFLPVPLQRTTLAEEHRKSIMLAIEGYLSQDENNPIVKAIAEQNGIDIREESGLNKYISQFIYLYPTEKAEGLESVLVRAGQNNTIKSKTPLIAITASGIEFGKPSVALGVSQNSQKLSGTISKNFTSPAQKLLQTKMLSKLDALLKTVMSNANRNALAANSDVVVVLNNEGETSTLKYSELLKQTHQTNILSVNVGGNDPNSLFAWDKPKWAYTIQPKILFDTSFANFTDIKPAAVAKARPKTAPVIPPVVSSTTETDAEVIAKAEAELSALESSTTPVSDKADIEKIRESLPDSQTNTRTPVTQKILDYFAEVSGIPKFTEDLSKGTYISWLQNANPIGYTVAEKLNSPKQAFDIISNYKAELSALQEPISQPTAPTAEETVEDRAMQILDAVGLEEIENILDALSQKLIAEQGLIDAGFKSYEDAVQSYQLAKKIFEERVKETKTITLPNGTVVKINKNTKDASELGEDFADTDDMIALLSESEIATIRTEIEDFIIRGIDPATQRSLVHYIAADIIKQTLAAKNKGSKQRIKVKPIFDKHKESFKQLAGFYQEAGLVNKAARLEAVVEQYDKLTNLVNQHMSLLTVGTVSENINLTDTEEAMGLEKVVYSDDWAFTVSSKSTSSADLKKFFSSIQDRDINGEPLDNILGLPEMLPYDTVYDTLHEILANRPADYDHMLEVLDLYKEKFPWIESVITELEKAPEKIQNEFVSDMAKHHIDMQFVMWSKDRNGNYSLQRWSSNKSAIEQRLRAIWNSNLKGVATQSNLVTVNDNDEYVFNKDVVDSTLKQLEEWKKNPSAVTNEELASWLGNFGIVLTDATYNDLRKGKYNNRGRKLWAALFTNEAGFVNVLAKQLERKQDLTLEDAELLNDSAVKALAQLDAENSLNTFSNSFQAGGKTIYSYGNNNYLVNRMRDLTAYDHESGTFINSDLIDKLKKISFVKDSLWLNELTSTKSIGNVTRSTLGIGYLSLEALKKKYTDSQDNRKLNNLTAAEHEVVKLGLFQNVSGETLEGFDTADKQERRLVNFFYLTMSDKTTMLAIRALARQFQLEGGTISRKNYETLYDALVVPEIKRMRDNQATDIAGYEPNYFYFMPSLNTLPITIDDQETTFKDVVLDKDDKLYSAEVKEAVISEIEKFFGKLVEKKLADWKNLGIGEQIKDDKGKIIEPFTFMDKEYMSKVAKTGKDITKVKYAAMDYVFNYLISNSESFKLFAGDPALYAKFKKDRTLQENLKETFANIGKRLAGDIAPGIELANSVHNQYYQVFLQDKKINSNNTKDSVQKEFFDKIIKDYSKNYSGIEGSDAQEYTTWQEHLYVLKQSGKITDAQYNNFKTKLTAQSQGVFQASTKLTFEELGMVMQPIKPVYVGNKTSIEDNADRRIYIKSSSFPLIPELTAGLQIDKVRQGLEKFEDSVKNEIGPDGTRPFVRASFGTANKVGAVKNAVEVFDNDGNVVDNFEVKLDNTLKLSRANFRIQQDVPYKRDKSENNRGTQETKLLFADLLDVQIEDGVTGESLMAEYNNTYHELFKYAQEKLSRRLGLIKTVSFEENFESLLAIPEPDLFNQVEELDTRLASASPIEKVKIQQEFADEVGEDTLERVNFINKNFDKIVEQLAKAKVNFFYDEETNSNKKCD